MGQLADLLSQPTAAEVTTSTEFDADGNYTQATVLAVQPATPHDLLVIFGHDPEKFAVDGPVGVSHRQLVDGRTVSTYRYRLCERFSAPDIDSLVAEAKKAGKHREIGSEGPFWFVFQAGDIQLGKKSRDGSTEEIVDGFMQSVERGVAEFKALAHHGIAGIQLCFPGDCLEGIVSQGGRLQWLTQETITEQTRIFRRLLMHAVEAFAPLTDALYLDTVNGNHDESQRQLSTYPGDGWATECAIAVDDALKMNPAAFGHVTVRVPDKWSGHMTVPVGDSIVTVAHGHQWPRTSGMKWWMEQGFNKQNPQHAHVLQHGHVHTYEVETTRDRTRVSSPPMDCGSDWWREKRGGDSKRGALAYLMSAGEVSRMSVV